MEKRLLSLIGIFITVLVFILSLLIFRPLDLPIQSDNIVIIEMDQRSIDELGRWPWSDEIWAKAIKMLSSEGVSIILLDVIFSKRPESVTELIKAINSSGSVILPYHETIPKELHSQLRAVWGEGSGGLHNEHFRIETFQVRVEGGRYKTLPAVAACKLMNDVNCVYDLHSVKLDNTDIAPFVNIPFSDVVLNKKLPLPLKGKVVIIAAGDALFGMRRTLWSGSVSSGTVMGVAILNFMAELKKR